MQSFIWTMILIMGFEGIVKVVLLAKGKTTEPTMASMAGDVILQVALIIWGVTLICR